MIDVSLDGRALQLGGLLDPGRYATAAHRAVSRGAQSLRTDAVRMIAQRVTLTQRYVRERLDLVVSPLGTFSRPGRGLQSIGDGSGVLAEARVIARKRGTRLDRYPNRQVWTRGKTVSRKRSGISVRVLRNGGSERIASAFYVPLRSGKVDGLGGKAIAIRASVAHEIGLIAGAENVSAASGKGDRRYVILYSSSVESEFRYSIKYLLPAARLQLTREFLRQVHLLQGT